MSASKLVNKSKNESYGKITISIGIAKYDLGSTTEEFVRNADRALYTAKRNGRDRVEVGACSQTLI